MKILESTKYFSILFQSQTDYQWTTLHCLYDSKGLNKKSFIEVGCIMILLFKFTKIVLIKAR